jgi:ArsR family transcriptional regulator
MPRPRQRDHTEVCARALKSLADPERLRIIQCLQTGTKNVGELCDLLKLPPANVSHHLGVLRTSGLVRDAKHGKYVAYSLDPEVFRPAADGKTSTIAELGCCRLDLRAAT